MTARWSVGITAVAVGLGTMIATAMSLLSRTSWLFDIAANFRFQYLWIGGLALAALAWNRWWGWFGLVALAAVINLAAVAPYWTSSIAEPAGEARLHITHLNTLASNRDFDAIIDLIRTSQSDLVFLAEVTPALQDAIAEADLPYAAVTGTPERTRIGILALARDQSATGRLTNLGVSEVPAVLVNTTLGDQPVTILSFHTSSPGEEHRAADRDDQLAAAAALVDQRDVPMVLVGDFNATPWTPAFRELLDAGLVDAQRGRGVAGSWPAGWGPFKIPIDHLLHTPELTTTGFEFGPSAGSDHRSLNVTIAPAA
ncbi:MAG: endonuclease/exonuclease/phosphatase family protein [Acidimicrobiia bacterium]|nr:endonuclease/exonuclease/phosphatase family protein [Acidimicrobiia bacterium]NNL70556.1 endonuclease/exonuclease/phosphatase family protein [Acidimicrobiia bacterium]